LKKEKTEVTTTKQNRKERQYGQKAGGESTTWHEDTESRKP